MEFSREQLEQQLESEKRRNESLIAAHTERQISDERYSMKWVENSARWGIYFVAAALLTALLGLIIVPKL